MTGQHTCARQRDKSATGVIEDGALRVLRSELRLIDRAISALTKLQTIQDRR